MDQVKKLLASLSNTQRWTILICALAVAGSVYGFSQWQRKAGLRPLYTSLSPDDAGAMVQKLREGGIEYRITEGGGTLLVPEAKVPELRLEMAGLGLPKTGRIGFEIFDKTNFGITDFAEHVNYRRAVEGELERSIMALAEVQQARVHVTLPKESVFTESREAAKASVLVGLRPGSRLSAQNVTAITNLISSAVEGLTSESVSVVDMRGNLLSRPRRDNLAEGAQITEAALDYKQALERDLMVKINNTLEPLLGADKYRTGVSAEVDMTSGEQSEESFDPTKSVMVTSQKTEDTNSTTHVTPAGSPGTAANLPTPPKPAGNTTGSSRKTENITYQSSRTTKHTKLPQGAIKRLSIAVLVNHTIKWEGPANALKRVVTPPAPEKLKTIQTVVATLVGLNPQRGDQLTVESLPFDNTLNMEAPNAAPAPVQQRPDGGLADLIKNKPILWGSVAGGVLMITVVIFGVTRGRKKRRGDVEVDDDLRLPAGLTPASLQMPAPSHASPMQHDSARALPPSRTEALLTQLQDSGKNNPELWANILRNWMSEEEAS